GLGSLTKKLVAKSKEGADATNAQEILTAKEAEEVRDPRSGLAKKDKRTADAECSEEHVGKEDGIAKKLDAVQKDGADATNAQEILTAKEAEEVRDPRSASAKKDKKTADAERSEEHVAKKDGIAKKLDAVQKDGADATNAQEILTAKEAEEVRDPRIASAKEDEKTADAEGSEEHVAKKDGLGSLTKKLDTKSKEGADATYAQETLTAQKTKEVRDPRIGSAKKGKSSDVESSEEHVAKKDGIAKKLEAKPTDGADATNAQETLTARKTEEVRDPRIASAKKDEKTADAESSEEHVAKKDGLGSLTKKLDTKSKDGADATNAQETLTAKKTEEVRDPRSGSSKKGKSSDVESSEEHVAKKDEKTADAESSEHVAKKDGLGSLTKKLDAKPTDGADVTNAQETLAAVKTKEVRGARIASAKKDGKSTYVENSEEHVAKNDGIARELYANSEEDAVASSKHPLFSLENGCGTVPPRVHVGNECDVMENCIARYQQNISVRDLKTGAIVMSFQQTHRFYIPYRY
ncbi:hypothetical protein ANCCAN_14418, partial [Ancylostoma caninum]